MSDEHPNATAYRKAADAFRVGDLGAIEALIDESVAWHVPGKHRRAGDILGREALLAWLKGLAPVGFWLREHDVFANDVHVCALSYMGARRQGLSIETRVVSIFHFRNGRQLERWFFPENADAFRGLIPVVEVDGSFIYRPRRGWFARRGDEKIPACPYVPAVARRDRVAEL
jgi:ketosteroid isomerase-like protein